MNPQFDQKTIEALKAARNQVMQAESPEHSRGTDKRRNEDANINKENPAAPKQAHNQFAEEFVQKLASVEKEKAAIDEEMAKLEDRRNELTKVKDKLQELDKEMSNVLKSQKI